MRKIITYCCVEELGEDRFREFEQDVPDNLSRLQADSSINGVMRQSQVVYAIEICDDGISLNRVVRDGWRNSVPWKGIDTPATRERIYHDVRFEKVVIPKITKRSPIGQAMDLFK